MLNVADRRAETRHPFQNDGLVDTSGCVMIRRARAPRKRYSRVLNSVEPSAILCLAVTSSYPFAIGRRASDEKDVNGSDSIMPQTVDEGVGCCSLDGPFGR